MTSNSFRKYLLYAFGEIALVMIGILLALQVSNWNQERVEQRIEKELLGQLHRDLTKGMKDLELNITIMNTAMNSGRLILDHMDSGRAYHDSLSLHFAKSLLWARLILNEGTYETIKSHGLEIISNAELRDAIVSIFEGRLSFLRTWEEVVQNYVEKMRNEISVEFFKSSYKGSTFTNRKVFYGRSEPIDYELLRKSHEFRYHLQTILDLMQSYQSIANYPYQNNLTALIEMIEREISN